MLGLLGGWVSFLHDVGKIIILNLLKDYIELS